MNGQRGIYFLFFLTLVVMEFALYWAFLGAPTDRLQGDVQRIFYFHLGSIAISFVGFFYVCFASVAFLITRNLKWDARALISGEVGLILATIVLLTGPIWAKPTWGTWWAWDARLASMLVLWLTFLGYVILRDYVESESKLPQIRAVFGIIGAAMVPFVYMSTRWFETQHPKPIIGGGEDSGIKDPDMVIALLLALAAFTLVYLIFCYCGASIQRLEGRVKRLRREMDFLED